VLGERLQHLLRLVALAGRVRVHAAVEDDRVIGQGRDEVIQFSHGPIARVGDLQAAALSQLPAYPVAGKIAVRVPSDQKDAAGGREEHAHEFQRRVDIGNPQQRADAGSCRKKRHTRRIEQANDKRRALPHRRLPRENPIEREVASGNDEVDALVRVLALQPAVEIQVVLRAWKATHVGALEKQREPSVIALGQRSSQVGLELREQRASQVLTVDQDDIQDRHTGALRPNRAR
jgi:hypothetical protein